MKTRMQPDDVDAFCFGSRLLGSGGGGDVLFSGLIARESVRAKNGLDLLTLDAIDDNAKIAVFGMVGALAAVDEKGPTTDMYQSGLAEMESRLGLHIDAVAPLLVGGANGPCALVGAAGVALPLLDCDGMGRVFPRLVLTSYAAYGVHMTPMVMIDEHLNTVTIASKDLTAAEKRMFELIVQMGLFQTVVAYAMTGRQAKESALRGTISLCKRIGEVMLKAQHRHAGFSTQELVGAICDDRHDRKCQIIFTGDIVSVDREVQDGMPRGHVVIKGVGESSGEMKIHFQNEFLLAELNGAPRAMTPDILALIDIDERMPVLVDELQYGGRVDVLAASISPLTRTSSALASMGPQAFGLSQTFTPFENEKGAR